MSFLLEKFFLATYNFLFLKSTIGSFEMPSQSLPEKVSVLFTPPGYKEFLEEVKKTIREAQLRAGLAVNRELVTAYWSIGKLILEK